MFDAGGADEEEFQDELFGNSEGYEGDRKKLFSLNIFCISFF